MKKSAIIILIIVIIILVMGGAIYFIYSKSKENQVNNENMLNSSETNSQIISEMNEENENAQENNNEGEIVKLNIIVNNSVLTATLADNSSVDALVGKLQDGPITISMSDYGEMEKVGSLGFSLPTNDESIRTEAGDLILYQGNSFVIYYDNNNWSLTRLGKIDNISQMKLKNILGDGNVTVRLELGD